MTRNKYLHSLGVKMLLRNSAYLKDTVDTLKDYEAALWEKEDLSAAISAMGTPSQAAAALKNKGDAGRIAHVAAAALLAAGLLRWAVLLFQNYWQPAGGSAALFSCFAVLILCVLLWVSARLNAQAIILPLREKGRGERLLLTLLCVITLLFAAAPYGGSYWVAEHASQLSHEQMLLVGPRMDEGINVLSALCLAFMLLAMQKAFSGSPRWAALFFLSLGASGTLLGFRHTLATLTDMETLWQRLMPCALPYVVSVVLTVALLITASVKAGQGEKLWTLK